MQFANGRWLVVRIRIRGWPAVSVMAEHVAQLLAQRFGLPGSRVIADCQAVISGYRKWRASMDGGLEYKNPTVGSGHKLQAFSRIEAQTR